MDDADEPNQARRNTRGGIWTSGRVAGLLGISPITLRSWDTRYGVGPSTRPEGRQRRYSDADVARLRRMRELIGRGVQAREAAQAVLAGEPVVVAGDNPDESRRELGDAVEAVRYASIATMLDELLSVEGTVRTWTEVVAPVLRGMEDRWAGGEECYASEWALVTEVSAAIDRHVRSFELPPVAGSVLLACCPGERHSLPVEALGGALAEARIPAVLLGGMVPPDTTRAMVAKANPAMVVLWSMSPETADFELRDSLHEAGTPLCLAGRGWGNLPGSEFPQVDDLAGAVALIGKLVG